MKLETLNLMEAQTEEVGKVERAFPKTFWKRQFHSEATKKQKIFDWVFGIIFPVICFTFDPTVFKGGIYSSGAFLADFKPFAYTLSFALIMMLLAFMLWGEKLKWINGFLSGLFAVGASISLIIGIFLLPWSLLGLIILIGALGFIPFFTAFVFLRNAFRTYKTAQSFVSQSVLINSFFLGAIFSLAIPFVLNAKVKQGLETMKNGDAQTIRATAQRFKYFAPLVNFDSLAWEYNSTQNSERNTALEKSFYQITGNDLKVLKDEKLKMRMAE